MGPIIEIIEGWTDPIEFQLTEGGQAIPLSGVTVTLLLRDRTGTTVPTTSMVTVVDEDDGTVLLTPSNANMFVAANGPYYARWKLTGAGIVVSYAPTGVRDIWYIVAV